MANYELQSITRPSIEFECGGERIISPTMKNLRINPNFDKPHLVFDVVSAALCLGRKRPHRIHVLVTVAQRSLLVN